MTEAFKEKGLLFGKALKNLDFRVPVLVILMAVHPLVPLPWALPRWAVLIVISIFALLLVVKDRLWVPGTVTIRLYLFLLAVLLSAVLSDYQGVVWLGDPGYMTGFISHVGYAVLFILALDVAYRSPMEMEKVLNLWLFSAFVIAWIGLLQYFGFNILPYGERTVFQATTSYSTIWNTNDLGNYMVMAFPFAAYYFLQKATVSTSLLVASIFAATLTTLTRGAWLALLAAFLFLFFFYPQKKNMVYLILIMTLVTAILMPMDDWKLAKRTGTFSGEVEKAVEGDPEAGSVRFLLWQEGLKALPQTVLIGTGPDTFYYVGEEKFVERWWEGARQAKKAHNIFLEIAVTMGIPALVLYLWFIWGAVAKASLRNPLHVAFIAVVIAYLVRGGFLVDVIQVYPLFWVLLGFCAGVSRSPSRPEAEI